MASPLVGTYFNLSEQWNLITAYCLAQQSPDMDGNSVRDLYGLAWFDRIQNACIQCAFGGNLDSTVLVQPSFYEMALANAKWCQTPGSTVVHFRCQSFSPSFSSQFSCFSSLLFVLRSKELGTVPTNESTHLWGQSPHSNVVHFRCHSRQIDQPRPVIDQA